MAAPVKAHPLDIRVLATHVDVAPGQEIRVRGSFRANDGAIIDAATTTWPEGSPGGEGVDAGGLVDFEGGGFRITTRDPLNHVVVAVATGDAAPACAIAGVQAPCLPMRTVHLARTRFMTRDELRGAMQGELTYELLAVAPPPPPAAAVPSRDTVTAPLAVGLAFAAVIAGVAVFTVRSRKRRAHIPEGRARVIVARVTKKLRGADAALAAAIAPVVEKAEKALTSRAVDPGGPEGRRVVELLVRVEARIDETARDARAAEEKRAADELALEMETALDAAKEAREL